MSKQPISLLWFLGGLTIAVVVFTLVTTSILSYDDGPLFFKIADGNVYRALNELNSTLKQQSQLISNALTVCKTNNEAQNQQFLLQFSKLHESNEFRVEQILQGISEVGVKKSINSDPEAHKPKAARRDLPLNLEKSDVCMWKFVEYIPSGYEKYWTDNIATLFSDACTASNKQLAEVEEWIRQASSNDKPHDFPTNVFSYFKYRNNCTGELTTDYIEPLAGVTRSPYFCLHGEPHHISKDYLVVSWNISKRLTSPTDHVPKAYLFDFGASMYNSGAGGASQQWFVETYESRGVKWDGIFAWEVSVYNPVESWALVPARLKPVYHWYNIPINPEPGHPDNALDYIRRTARPEDYVLLKIDIDNSPVEEALVGQILASEELLGLIDEFYFEHHVNVPNTRLTGYWQTASSPLTLVDTYRIFATLRSKGVAAHGWV